MATSGTDTVAQALWYIAPGQAEIRRETLAPAAPGEARVRTLFGALSRGTEALVLAGRIPESEHERMRAPFMAGSFPFPVKYGYATVGKIEDGPQDMRGRSVFALHPHQSLFNISAQLAVLLPDNIPPQRAVLAANMETALNAVWDAAVGPADRVAIVGGGTVGALVAFLCGKMPGTDVTLVDINPARLELAEKLGVRFAKPETARSDCDIVFHTSGSAAGLATALTLAGEEAAVLEMSWYGDMSVAASLGGAFHSRRLRLISSQVGRIAPSHRPRWTHARRLAAAVALLADARLDALLAPAVAFHDLPKKISGILDPKNGILCQLIAY
ncbi:MAG TPA: zinc-binding alcohol dehydrogenase [Pseudolabrys sp.]